MDRDKHLFNLCIFMHTNKIEGKYNVMRFHMKKISLPFKSFPKKCIIE